MKFTSDSKRLDFAREIFYWASFMRAVDKLDNTTYGLIVGAIITSYLANRWLTDNKVGATTGEISK